MIAKVAGKKPTTREAVTHLRAALPLSDGPTREWLTREGFDLTKAISWSDNETLTLRRFAQTEA